MQVIQLEAGRITITTTQMSGPSRLLLVVAALAPFYGPYALVSGAPLWAQGPLSRLLFVIAAASALILAVILVGLALFTEKREVEFDSESEQVRFTVSRFLMNSRQTLIDFHDIVRCEVIDHAAPDMQSSYDIRLVRRTGPKIEFGEFDSRSELMETARRLCTLIHQ